MFAFLIKLLLVALSRLNSRARLEAENLVLRQQLILLSRKFSSRVRLRNIDRLIFAWLYRCFPSTLNAIIVVKPETIIRWHHADFGPIGAGSPADKVVAPRSTARSANSSGRMSKENPLWGAPRIHGELLMLGLELAQSTVARYMTRRQGPPGRIIR